MIMRSKPPGGERVALRSQARWAPGGFGRVLWVLGVLGGCLDIPDDPVPMCDVDNDCDRSHGEVCEEGVCWGNPPPGPFAAVISPPSARHDLVPREQPQVTIPDFGWMGDLALEAPVTLTGHIITSCPAPCDPLKPGATVTVSRPSQFHGGPGFNTVINVKPGETFSIPVPRTHDGEDPYDVMIVPDGGSEPGSGAAALVPPQHVQLRIVDNMAKTFVLGGLGLPTISGSLTDSFNQGIADYRIAALGQWDSTSPPTEVSTIHVTDATGLFSVTLSAELTGTVELVARPLNDAIAPAIHLANIDFTKVLPRNIIVPTSLGRPVVLDSAVQVMGLDRSGVVAPVRGATVSVTGTLTTTLTSFTITDEQVTNSDGKVTLHLLDGIGIAGSYRLSIIPPASASLGVVFDQKFTLGQDPRIRLPARVAVHGRIIDGAGNPLPNVTVTARPSLRFLWTLEPAPQTFVAGIPSSTAVTPDTTSGSGAGSFVVWVDPNVAQVWGYYDLLIEPAATARVPAFLKPEVVIPRDGTLDSIGLGDIAVPESAFVHGRITGADGQPVENAELRLYLVSTALSLCSEVAHAPAACPIPAELQARSTSDDEGIVRLILPRAAY
jgi:hypothetical protein